MELAAIGMITLYYFERGGVPCKYTSVKSITKKVISTKLLFFKK